MLGTDPQTGRRPEDFSMRTVAGAPAPPIEETQPVLDKTHAALTGAGEASQYVLSDSLASSVEFVGEFRLG